MASKAADGDTLPVGVLALQGDFVDHEAALQRHGLRTRQVRTVADLNALGGLVLPGGESTTMLKLLDVDGLWEPLGVAGLLGMSRWQVQHSAAIYALFTQGLRGAGGWPIACSTVARMTSASGPAIVVRP